jgi:CheY-like chemotaxis protein
MRSAARHYCLTLFGNSVYFQTKPSYVTGGVQLNAKRKILIVDDDPDFIEATKIILESADYEVISAKNGTQGLEMVTLESPDLIILDIMMDSMFEGFAVSAALKMTADYIDFRHTPILMVSSLRKDLEYKTKAPKKAEGIAGDQYMDKPLEPKALLSKISEMLHTA